MLDFIQHLLPETPYLDIENIEALFFYFLLYSCFGWLLENTYNVALGESFWKDGFLQGPYKPMYGIAPVSLLLLTGPETGFRVSFLLCLTVPTLVEYISGLILKGIFHKPYWDYSHFRYQLHGHICIPYSLCWLGLCLVFLYFVHPAVASFYAVIAPVWHPIWAIAALLYTADVIWSAGSLLKRAPVVAD